MKLAKSVFIVAMFASPALASDNQATGMVNEEAMEAQTEQAVETENQTKAMAQYISIYFSSRSGAWGSYRDGYLPRARGMAKGGCEKENAGAGEC